MASKVAISVKNMNSQKIINLAPGTDNTTDAANTAQVQAARDFAISRANHTGSQTAATISDFNTAVRLNRLDQLAAPTGPVAWGSQQLTALADGTANTHAATWGQVQAAIAALSSGLVFKGAVRAVSSADVNTTSAPATIDGVTPTSGDVFLLTAQTTGSQNGPWVWTSAGAAMTRPTNFDVAGEAVPGSLWVVQQGTRDNQLAILSNNTFVLGTDTATFDYLNPATAADNDTGYAENCPVTAAGVAWPVNHNLGTKDVIVSVRRVASPFDEVDANITFDTTNQVNVRADIALAAGEYRAVVSKVV